MIWLYEAIPVWSGLSKYIIFRNNVTGAAGTRVADKAIIEDSHSSTGLHLVIFLTISKEWYCSFFSIIVK